MPCYEFETSIYAEDNPILIKNLVERGIPATYEYLAGSCPDLFDWSTAMGFEPNDTSPNSLAQNQNVEFLQAKWKKRPCVILIEHNMAHIFTKKTRKEPLPEFLTDQTWSGQELNEAVIQTALQLAEQINNRGFHEQIRFIEKFGKSKSFSIRKYDTSPASEVL